MSIRHACPLLFAAALTLALGCQHVAASAAPDGGGGDADADSDGDTETDSAPWSTPQSAGVLGSVWGSGPDDVYAGGAGRTLLHGSGSTWELLPLPAGSTVTDLHGSAADSVYVVLGGAAFGMVLRRDGDGWSSTGYLDGDQPRIWVAGADHVWAIDSYVLLMEPGVNGANASRFDGAAWSGVWGDDYVTEDGADWLFDDLTGTAAGYLFAVGVDWGFDPQPAAIVSDGESWWIEVVPASGLHGVWALDDDHVWAVGDGGAVIRRGDVAWEHEETPVAARLGGIFGWGAGVRIAVGDGVILRDDGAGWEQMDLPIAGAQLNGVWGAAPDDVYAVGGLGGGALVLRFDGAAWSVVYGG